MKFKAWSIFPLAILMVACNKFNDLEEPTPLPTEEEYMTEIVNPDYVNIDWDSVNLIRCESDKGKFEFSSSPVTDNLRPGNILTIDADTAVYRRKMSIFY